jgi:hypothetical protein
MVDCVIQAGEQTEDQRTASNDSCRQQFDPVLECEKSVSVSDNYSACMRDVPSVDCAAAVTVFKGSDADILPATCKGVILR